MKLLLTKYKHPLWMWLAFSIFTFTIYYPAHNMCVYDDLINFYAAVKKIGWVGIQNSFGYSSNYYTHNLLMISLYKVFSIHQIYYYIVGCVWHAGNTTLFYFLLKKWMHFFGNFRNKYLPILASIYWIVCCTQIENIVYMGTLQYQYALSILLVVLHYFTLWSQGYSIAVFKIILLNLFYLSGFFAQEICILFPFILVAIMLWWKLLKISKQSWKQFYIQIFIPMIFYVLIYFLWHYFIFRNFLPHYGQMHLQGYHLPFITEQFSINIFKNILLVGFLPIELRIWFYAMAKNTYWMLALWLSVAGILIYIAKRKSKQSAINTAFLIILFLILYAPSANFVCYVLDINANDRLMFFAKLLIVIISFILLDTSKKVVILFSVFYLTIHLILLQIGIKQYQGASIILKNLTSTITVKQNEKVLFLNLPYQFKGVNLCRYSYSIAHYLNVFRNIDLSNNYVCIARQVRLNESQNTKIIKVNDSTIRVENMQLDEWYNMDGTQQKSSVDSFYKIATTDGINGYQLSISSNPKNLRLLYLNDIGFQEFHLATDSFVHIFHR